MPPKLTSTSRNFKDATFGHIPLTIIEKSSKEVITKKSAFLNVNRQKDKTVIAAICQEGVFYVCLTESNIIELKGKKQTKKYNDEEWRGIVYELLSFEHEVEDLQIVADLITESEYDSKNHEVEEVSDSEMVLIIQTRAKLPVKLGEIPLAQVDDEEEKLPKEIKQDVFEIFNWMEAISGQNDKLKAIVDRMAKKEKSLDELVKLKTKEIDEIRQEYEEIIEDLQDKFYQVLNAKKSRIWELEGRNEKELEYLNQTYIEQNRKNFNHGVIKKEEIPDEIDEAYKPPTRKRKQKEENRPKRRKKEPVKEDNATQEDTEYLANEMDIDDSESHSSDEQEIDETQLEQKQADGKDRSKEVEVKQEDHDMVTTDREGEKESLDSGADTDYSEEED